LGGAFSKLPSTRLNSGSFAGSDLAMSAPWDRPPPPTQADADVEVLYAAIGCSLSHWEDIESELSHWYALCIGKMWQHVAYNEYYDRGRTCQGRITTVANAAEEYFVKNPNQEAEGNLDCLVEATRGFAARRHELAHGIVRPIRWYWPFVEATMKPPVGMRDEYCLVPPHYQRSWYNQEKWNPEFVYTSKEVYAIDCALVDHLHLLLHFRHDYLPKPPPRGSASN